MSIKKLNEAERTILLCSILFLVARILMFYFKVPTLLDFFLTGSLAGRLPGRILRIMPSFFFVSIMLLPISIASLWGLLSSYSRKSLIFLRLIGVVEMINNIISFFFLAWVLYIGPSFGKEMPSPILLLHPFLCFILAMELAGAAKDALKEKSANTPQ